MSRNTSSKMALNQQRNKDPNTGIFFDTSGRVFETYHLEWSRIYNIFYNDEFSGIQHDQMTFVNIRKSQLHAIASMPTLMPYTDPIKWIIDYEKPQCHSFNDQDQTQLTLFLPKVFSRAYTHKQPQ